MKQLRVEPEGKTHFVNKAILLDFRHGRSSSKLLWTWRSQKTLFHIRRKLKFLLLVTCLVELLKIWTSWFDVAMAVCGEQNMLNFVPNILVLDYLRGMKKTIPGLESKAIGFMELGYQKQLRFKRYDGSFSAFGKWDQSGSTWLTAFVVKSFYQAKKYINIQDSVIKQALNWRIGKWHRINSIRFDCFPRGSIYGWQSQGYNW